MLLTGCASLTKPEGQGGLFQVHDEVEYGLALQPDGTVAEVPISTNRVTRVNKTVTSAISQIKDINSAVNPTPSAPLVNLGLTALTAILGAVATYQTKREREKSKALDLTLESIEESKNDDVKERIDRRSKEVGMSDFIHRRVRKLPKK